MVVLCNTRSMLVKARWASPIHSFGCCVGRVDRYWLRPRVREVVRSCEVQRLRALRTRRFLACGCAALVRCQTQRYATSESARGPQIDSDRSAKNPFCGQRRVQSKKETYEPGRRITCVHLRPLDKQSAARACPVMRFGCPRSVNVRESVLIDTAQAGR